jgi:hypothetical protein
MPNHTENPDTLSAKEIFSTVEPEYQALIREVLAQEREVMHLKKRHEIHSDIYNHVKRIIK